MKKAALISVADKRGLKEFAETLRGCGYDLLATAGSRTFLDREGIPTVSIEEYTGQKEILDGRVKTLHPRIHAGLLARRDNADHVQELNTNNLYSIDIAVVNLYPFSQTLRSDPGAAMEKMVEYVDIGGPTMIRGAAKNHRFVLPLIDPSDYEVVTPYLLEGRPVPTEVRVALAGKVFTKMVEYDLEIAKYITRQAAKIPEGELGAIEGLVLEKQQPLRYGENSHQRGAFYRATGEAGPSWVQRNGKELSYNNLLDFDATLRLVRSFRDAGPTAVIIKHMNPCGAATAGTLLDALRGAKLGDPRSHFGGVLGFNRTVTVEVAEAIGEDFAEVVLAPGFDPDALELLRKKKALRVIETPLAGASGLEIRAVEGGYLLQDPDRDDSPLDVSLCVTESKPHDAQLKDLQFAWRVCAHVKSNATVLVKNEMILGTGAGQMSRVDSVEIAISKAKRHGHDLHGACAASDGFFPFPDSIETLASEGISAVVAPSGAKRDDASVAAANAKGVSLLFATNRHFRH